MEYLPLFKIIAVFAFMVLAVRFRAGLDLAILLGGALLALFFGMSPLGWLESAWLGLSSAKALYLAAIVGLILILSHLMDSTGQAARFMDHVRTRMRSPRLALAFFPALIGLLPMPGGAVFSAPMVANVSKDMDVDPATLAAVNYWFRHVWEFCWPLYPGLILAASLADMELAVLLLYCAPGTVFFAIIGWVFLLRPGKLPLPTLQDTEDAAVRSSAGAIIWAGLPLLTAIVGAICLELTLALVFPAIPHEWGIITALFLAIVVATAQNSDAKAHLYKSIFRMRLVRLLLVVGAIYVFKEILLGSGAVEQVAAMAHGNAALLTTATILPFLVGMVGGIAIAFAGAVFPLLVELVLQTGNSHLMPAYMVLGWFCGFAGVMSSPMHICFLLTCQYFAIDLAKVWRKIALGCLVLLVLGLGYFFLLKSVLE
ncbi:MAG: DUF401 family protein [Desulfovibrio sp.]|nr:MAG: DUF401 family protein [Desulfovibrio sp.]